MRDLTPTISTLVGVSHIHQAKRPTHNRVHDLLVFCHSLILWKTRTRYVNNNRARLCWRAGEICWHWQTEPQKKVSNFSSSHVTLINEIHLHDSIMNRFWKLNCVCMSHSSLNDALSCINVICERGALKGHMSTCIYLTLFLSRAYCSEGISILKTALHNTFGIGSRWEIIKTLHISHSDMVFLVTCTGMFAISQWQCTGPVWTNRSHPISSLNVCSLLTNESACVCVCPFCHTYAYYALCRFSVLVWRMFQKNVRGLPPSHDYV